jgi:hypothetical protein
MKKILTATLTVSVALFTFGCGGLSPAVQEASKLSSRDVCNVEKNGIDAVLASAEKYNKSAVEEGVEFTRLGMSNRTLIAETKKALESGAKEVQYLDKDGKPTKEKRSVEYSAARACKFAISALSQKAEAENEWRLAVPGDGYKY